MFIDHQTEAGPNPKNTTKTKLKGILTNQILRATLIKTLLVSPAPFNPPPRIMPQAMNGSLTILI